jgi:hypothetical protein
MRTNGHDRYNVIVFKVGLHDDVLLARGFQLVERGTPGAHVSYLHVYC